jgi:hypothetical protein
MAGPGMAVIGTAKQGRSVEWQRSAMAMDGIVWQRLGVDARR